MTAPFVDSPPRSDTWRRRRGAGWVRYTIFQIVISAALFTHALAAEEPDPAPIPSPNEPALEKAEPEKTTRTITTPSRTSTRTSRNRSSRTRYRDLVVFGQNAVIKEGEHFGDVVVIAGKAEVHGAIHGDLVTVGGEAHIYPTGTASRDVVVVAGNAKLEAGATVRGDVVTVAGVMEVDPAAVVQGDLQIYGGPYQWLIWPAIQWPADWFQHGLLLGRPLPHQHLWSWGIAGFLLLIYILVSLLFPRSVELCVKTLDHQPGTAFLTGLLAFLLLLPLLMLLVVSIVGIVIVPFLLSGFVAIFVFGKTAVYRYAGQQLGHQFGWEPLERPLLALVVGAALFYLLYAVPVVGFLVWATVAPLGLGAVLLAFSNRERAGRPGTVAMPGVPVMPPPPTETGFASPPQIGMLARAGFWRRVLATLLDFVLIAMVMFVVLREREWFLLAWTLYHLGMWGWKGTTIGGVVVGLKILRTDGRPITFSVALVRVLAAFFSAAVLLLGFFWAGWSREKQSWHDVIAGTVVVRVPKGTSLV